MIICYAGTEFSASVFSKLKAFLKSKSTALCIELYSNRIEASSKISGFTYNCAEHFQDITTACMKKKKISTCVHILRG